MSHYRFAMIGTDFNGHKYGIGFFLASEFFIVQFDSEKKVFPLELALNWLREKGLPEESVQSLKEALLSKSN